MVHCTQPSDSSYNWDTTCYDMKINATGSSLYSSSTFININCDIDGTYSDRYPCGYSTFRTSNFNQLTMNCNNNESCEGIKLYSNSNNNININCNDESSCNNAHFYIYDSNNVGINGMAEDALRVAEIIIDGISGELSQIDCNYRTSCQLSDITIQNVNGNGDNDTVTLNCYHDTLNGLHIKIHAMVLI